MEMQLIHYASAILLAITLLFLMHYLRSRAYFGLFYMFIVMLWFLSYLTGHFGISLKLAITDTFTLKIRYSSSFYTLIFVGTLLMYITEGVQRTRNLIFVSAGIQFALLGMQVFFFYLVLPIVPEKNQAAAKLLFEPSYLRFAISIAAAIVALFFNVLTFQFLVNRLPKVPSGILLFLSLAAAMVLDSFIFVAGTRFETFWATIGSHLIVKTSLVFVAAIPFSLYINRYGQKGHLSLRRGTLDIFTKIEALEQDLAKANEELKEYANNLEIKVEERTKEIREKQRIIDLELAMASEVQKSLLPPSEILENIDLAIRYLPASAVSGDLYHFGMTGKESMFIFLGDISGHGVPSALVGAMINMSLARIDLRSEQPADIIQRITDDLIPIESDHYLTAIFATIDLSERRIIFCNGGHPDALLISKSGKSMRLEPTGGLVGIPFSDGFSQKGFQYFEDTLLALYSDCITEHKNAQNEEFGIERFERILVQNTHLSCEEIAKIIEDEVRFFGNGAEFKDDFSLILARLP